MLGAWPRPCILRTRRPPKPLKEQKEWRRRVKKTVENDDRVWAEIEKAREKIFSPESMFDTALVPWTALKGLVFSGMAALDVDPWFDAALKQRNDYGAQLLRKYGREELEGNGWWS